MAVQNCEDTSESQSWMHNSHSTARNASVSILCKWLPIRIDLLRSRAHVLRLILQEKRLRIAVDRKQKSSWTVSPPLDIPKSQYFHRLGHHWTTMVPCDFDIPDVPIPVAGSRRHEEQFAFIKAGLPRDVIASMSPFGNSDTPQVMSRSDHLDLYPRITDGPGRSNEHFEPRPVPSLESTLLNPNALHPYDVPDEIFVYVQPRVEETSNEVYHGFQMVNPMMGFAAVNDVSPSSTWHRGESSRTHTHNDDMEEDSDSEPTLWTIFTGFDPTV